MAIPKPLGGHRLGRPRRGSCSRRRGDPYPKMTPLGGAVRGAVPSAPVQQTSGRGGWSGENVVGRIRGGAGRHGDGSTGAAGRRQVPTPTAQDCPLRTTETVPHSCYTSGPHAGVEAPCQQPCPHPAFSVHSRLPTRGGRRLGLSSRSAPRSPSSEGRIQAAGTRKKPHPGVLSSH